MKTVVRDQGNRMDAVSHFTVLCELMKDYPPSAVDAPQLAKFVRLRPETKIKLAVMRLSIGAG